MARLGLPENDLAGRGGRRVVRLGAAVAAALRGGPPAVVSIGLGRIVALYHRSSTSYQIHEQIWRLYFWRGNATEP